MKLLLFLSAWLCLTTFPPTTQPAKISLSGTVRDAASNDPLPGASVILWHDHKTVAQATTDARGVFKLVVEPDVYDIECRYTGYVTQRFVALKLDKTGQDSINFRLSGGASLNEVVVTDRDPRTNDANGYDAKRREGTGAVALASSGRGLAKKEMPAGRPAPAPASTVAPSKPAAVNPDARYDSAPKAAVKRAMPVTADKPVDDEKKPAAETPAVLNKATSGAYQPAPHAGLLTAGEWNDLHNWNKHWLDLLSDGEIAPYQKMYGFYPQNRYPVLLTNARDFPVMDAAVKLLSASGETIWEARTDNTGKAELWAGLYDQTAPAGLQVEALVNGKAYPLGAPKIAKDGINRYQIQVDCNAPKTVDIVWTVDATGSMGDEIEYLKTELLDVIGRAKTTHPDLTFRMGTVFYRDKGDDYLTKSSGLSYDISKTVDFIRKQFAGGGGDYPEAVHTALEEAIYNQQWSDNAVARICFLVLDASPHQDPAVNESLHRSIREAARLGIRIIPVTASGIQKDTEFLMKFFGLATNGTYVFLTDHSGIGGKHLEPTTDEYKVELLNSLLVRLISEYTAIKTCDGQSTIRFDDPQQQQQQQQTIQIPEAKYYPNPASRQFTLELPFDVQSVTIYDAEGKAVRKLENPQAGVQTDLVSDLPEGFYTIRILKDGTSQSGKLMVVRA